MPPHAVVRECPSTVIALPTAAAGSTHTIAVRIYFKGLNAGGIGSRSYLGDEGVIERLAQSESDWLWRLLAPATFMMVLEVLGLIFACWLFFVTRNNYEYLWFGLLMASQADITWVGINSIAFTNNPSLWPAESSVVNIAENLATLAFLYVLFKARRSAWLYVAIAGSVCSAVNVFAILGEFFPRTANAVLTIFQPISAMLILPGFLWILVLLMRRAWAGWFEARLLILPILLARDAGCS